MNTKKKVLRSPLADMHSTVLWGMRLLPTASKEGPRKKKEALIPHTYLDLDDPPWESWL